MIEAAGREWPGRDFVLGDPFDQTLDLDSFDVILAGGLLDVIAKLDRDSTVSSRRASPTFSSTGSG